MKKTAAMLAASLVTLSAGASAAPSGHQERVTLIVEPGTERQRAQVAEDLRSLGYHVIVVEEESSAQGPPDASAYRAIAAVRLRQGGRSIELWTLKDGARRADLLAIVNPSGESDLDSSDAAVHAVELLRAALLEIRTPHRDTGSAPNSPSVADASPPRTPVVVQVPPRDRAATLGVAAGFGVVSGLGTTGINGTVPLRVHAFPDAIWSLELQAGIPVLRSSIQAQEGTARLSQSSLGLDVRAAIPVHSRLVPVLGAGVSVTRMAMSAEASMGYVASDDTRTSAVAYLQAGGFVRLGGHLRLRLDTAAGYAARAMELRFVDREVGKWGPVVLKSEISFEAVVF